MAAVMMVLAVRSEDGNEISHDSVDAHLAPSLPPTPVCALHGVCPLEPKAFKIALVWGPLQKKALFKGYCLLESLTLSLETFEIMANGRTLDSQSQT